MKIHEIAKKIIPSVFTTDPAD